MAEGPQNGGEGPHDGWLEKLFKRQLVRTTDGEKEVMVKKNQIRFYGVRFLGQGDEEKGLQMLNIVNKNKKEKYKYGWLAGCSGAC